VALGLELTHTAVDGSNAPKTAQPVLRNPASLGNLSALDVVVVDDIAGSGETIVAAVRLVRASGARRVRTFVCAVNTLNWRHTRDRPADIVGREIAGWVKFPWETL